MNKTLRLAIFALALVAQAAVPGWMLVKHHLILTRGERFVLPVTLGDPRDLFMGHYARLRVAEDALPEALRDVPDNYLRYYCDQRYARQIDRSVASLRGELTVRLWRGAALAEGLTIEGLPAHDYLARAAAGQAPSGAPFYEDTLFAIEPFPGALELSSGDVHGLCGLASPTAIMQGLVVPVGYADYRRYVARAALRGEPRQTPREARHAWACARDWAEKQDRWAEGKRILVLPLPDPPATADYGTAAGAYYQEVEETFVDWSRGRDKLLFYGEPGERAPRTVQSTLAKALPGARWLLPAEQLPEGLDASHVCLLLDAPPKRNPGAEWFLRASPGAYPEISAEGFQGWVQTVDPFGPLPPPQPGEAAKYAAALREAQSSCERELLCRRLAKALACEAQAQGDADGLERALAHIPLRTLRHYYENTCETYADWRALVAYLAARERAGRPVLLAGWRAIAPHADDPPPPPVPEPSAKSRAEDLLDLADRLLGE